MKLNKEHIEYQIECGYIAKTKHPEFPLWILNYTRQAQFERIWNEYTKICRGLVVDEEYNIIAWCFPKFFNYSEHRPEDIPVLPFEAFDKMDGSLGIVFYYNKQWNVATRGSFASDQAMKGAQLLKKYDTDVLDTRNTYLFEIIYPENRIVCDYEGQEKLVLLAVIENSMGVELPYESDETNSVSEYELYGYDVVKRFDGLNDIAAIKALNIDNKEGFVLRFSDGFRVKVKFDEYCRLHSIVTGVSTKVVWRALRDGKDLSELLDRVPDEFDVWVREQIARLKADYDAIDKKAKIDCLMLLLQMIKEKVEITNKSFAERALKLDNHHFVLAVFNGKAENNMFYGKAIWRHVEPLFEKPFLKYEVDLE
jgi:hypothetical protein